jgi:5-methylcytosine-specific restriction endonuclease McrA
MSDLSKPAALRRLIEESGGAFAVVEEAIEALRQQMSELDPSDPDVIEVLRAHLLAIGSPSDVMKYFSLELLERADPERATATYVEVAEQLARSPINPERAYPVEREMIKKLGEDEVSAALPALALLASREVYPLSRTAARAVAKIVGSTNQEAITERLRRGDLPEISRPGELGEGVGRALFSPSKGSSARSSQERRRKLTHQNAQAPLAGQASAALRPESANARQRRLHAILLAAGRDPAKCGNCELPGKTKVMAVVPVDRGGHDRAGNLVALCVDCRRKLPRHRQDESGRAPAVEAASGQLDLF